MVAATAVAINSFDRRTDAHLIQACLNGDSDAWDALVERYKRLVYSIPLRCGLSEADASDVFQGVWLIVLQKLSTVINMERFKSWLITTTRREVWRMSRESKSMSTSGNAPFWCGYGHDENEPNVEAMRRHNIHMIRHALDALGSPGRELLTALFSNLQESNYEAIAQRLNMKAGSIGPTRSRQFRKFKRILLDLGFDSSVQTTPLFRQTWEIDARNN